MFDISLTELILCFVVALVVLGPEKLPAVARTLGRWTGQARIYMRNLTSELERETSGHEMTTGLRDAKKILEDEAKSVKSSLDDISGPPRG